MDEVYQVVLAVLAAFFLSGIVSFVMTPPVKQLAYKFGAVDVPKDNRRMHKRPIPRMGGLAIFIGFIIAAYFTTVHTPKQLWILAGAAIIVVLGIVDDCNALGAKFKFVIQIIAACLPVLGGGLRIGMFTNPFWFSPNLYLPLGALSIPITILWIVAITNAVNLIDGLDGLAVGISSIASMTMLAVALFIGEPQIAILLAALAGACVGFMPYNLNPATIFMGDTGSTFLGYMLATLSIQGLFKMYALISFAVPFLILGLPIFDTAFAMLRRILSGRSPFSADRGHVHHRLIDMGFNQKQAVAILYVVSTVLGLLAVVLTTGGELRALFCAAAVIIVVIVGGLLAIASGQRRIDIYEQKFREKKLMKELEEQAKAMKEAAKKAEKEATEEAADEPEKDENPEKEETSKGQEEAHE